MLIWRAIKSKIGFSFLNRDRAVINNQEELESYLDGDTYKLPNYAIINNCRIVVGKDRKIVASNILLGANARLECVPNDDVNAHISFEDKDLERNKLIQGSTNMDESSSLLEDKAKVEELQSAQDIIEYVLLHGESHSEIGRMLEEMVSEHKAKAEGGSK